MSKVYSNHDSTILKQKSKRLSLNIESEESKELQRMEHLLFERVSSIQFCVDSAIGLPFSCTATRITARLLSYDRTQIGESSVPCYSSPESDYMSPKFDLHEGWRGTKLNPSITIVCRIDTLEKPTLVAKNIGFAALKLCVTESGFQPLPDGDERSVYLNAGQYLLPIVYGKVPASGIFSESLMDSLPHLPDAYLCVRLFDPNVDKEKFSRKEKSFKGPSNGKISVINSVAYEIINYLPFGHENLPSLPINAILKDEIKQGLDIDKGELNMVIKQCNQWIQNAFPPIKNKISMIDPRYISKYDRQSGALVALDMLYNMPKRTDLLKTTKRVLFNMDPNVKRKYKWDNNVSLYKTYFKYLPGSTRNKKFKKENPIDLIIDDASLELDGSSREANPIYLDDYSRTSGFNLSQNACLLVIVTAVDVLTTSNKNYSGPNYFSPEIISEQSKSNYDHIVQMKSHEEESMIEKERKERAFKLKGLLGIYMADDYDDIWWGITPLMTENPSTKLPNNKSNAFSPSNYSSNLSSPKKSQTPSTPKVFSESISPPGTAPGSTPRGLNEMNSFFVDAGTHQVPLFKGFPPEEIIRAPNPMFALYSSLVEQQKRISKKTNFCCFSSREADFQVIDPRSRKTLKQNLSSFDLHLEPGASAFISLIDGRMKSFGNESISKDPSLVPVEEVLVKILKILSTKYDFSKGNWLPVDQNKYSKLRSKYSFDFSSIHSNKKRTIKQAISHNIYYDELLKEINDVFVKKISEE